MKLHDKIRGLIKQKYGKLTVFHRRIVELFGNKAITYRTLINSFGKKKTNERQLFQSTLVQIAAALEVSDEKLKEGTERELPYSRYKYENDAFIDLLNTKLPFLVGRLELGPGKMTTSGHYDPPEKGDFIKFVYCLEGIITIIIDFETEVKRVEISKGENYAFKSTFKHHFENETQRKAKCLVVQNPKYY